MLKAKPLNISGSLYILLPATIRRGFDIENGDTVLFDILGVEKQKSEDVTTI